MMCSEYFQATYLSHTVSFLYYNERTRLDKLVYLYTSYEEVARNTSLFNCIVQSIEVMLIFWLTKCLLCIHSL